MLQYLSIENYTLINKIAIKFDDGFSVITGETGAGKSIILGALGLVLGDRYEQKIVPNSHKKTIIEACFNLEEYELSNLFKERDWDYQKETIIRRIVLPQGKSRSFINDVPVTIKDLKLLGANIMDIHGQNDNKDLDDKAYHFHIFDSLCGPTQYGLLEEYRSTLKKYQQKQQEKAAYIATKLQNEKEQEYQQHLYEELEKVSLVKGEQKEIEQKIQRHHHKSEIVSLLNENITITENEQSGLITLVSKLLKNTQAIISFNHQENDHLNRLNTVKIELEDIAHDFHEQLSNRLDAGEENIETLEERMNLLWDLSRKHQVSNSDELIEIKTELSKKISHTVKIDDHIIRLDGEIRTLEKILSESANILMKNRKKIIDSTTNRIKNVLSKLGMKDTQIEVLMRPNDDFNTYGKHDLNIQISTNKGVAMGSLKKLSGGERSRIMFAIKWILSQINKLPTIIFDEIDTGVSGEIALKMGEMMQTMGKQLQILSITHLPQVAAKGSWHYQVIKETVNGQTESTLKKLTQEERTNIIAKMVSGDHPQKAALEHAKDLLNTKNNL